MKKINKKCFTIIEVNMEYDEYEEYPTKYFFNSKEKASEFLHNKIYPEEVKFLEEEVRSGNCPYSHPFWKFEMNTPTGSKTPREELWLKTFFVDEEFYAGRFYYIEEKDIELYE